MTEGERRDVRVCVRVQSVCVHMRMCMLFYVCVLRVWR